MPLPADLPPRLAFAAQRALRFPDEVHTDSCGWMGSDFPHPCRCGVPALVEWLIERYGLGDDASST